MSTGRASSTGALLGYTLVICEKPDAAKRVAEALSGGSPDGSEVERVPVFRLEDRLGRRFVVCAASGHLYGVSDTVKNRRVYPVADFEWFPIDEVEKRGSRASNRIRAIRRLADGATAFVNACDLDVEGETIGYNVLRYACGGKETSARRAAFSSLTAEEIVDAFSEDRLAPMGGGALAGRLRHALDFLWGINLSRALSEATRTNGGFMTVSMGRVQGPTLNFVVEREIAVQTFVPTPYWKVTAVFGKGESTFEANYSSAVVKKRAADEIRDASQGREGVVSGVAVNASHERPPPPFNLPDLQKEGFRILGYPPSKTLAIAERLYLAALVSYPRTQSQRLPRLDYARLLAKVASFPEYSAIAGVVVARGAPSPREGAETDSAHPAIYPTGERPRRALGVEERNVLDLVVRRFLSCFLEDSVVERASARISVGTHEFVAGATRVLAPGWKMVYQGGMRVESRSASVPPLHVGDLLRVVSVASEERLRSHQGRHNQVTLLETMEREEIGTKSTRGEVISALLARGYVTGANLVPTELGFVVVEVMQERCPQIVSTRLTRDIEAQLERVETSGSSGWATFEGALVPFLSQVGEMRSREAEIAAKLRILPREVHGQIVLGACPVCGSGSLWVVRSRKTNKRFVGCTNYAKGCRASAPLPQRGIIRAMTRPCSACGWPVVSTRRRGRLWKLCVNDRCPRKVNVYSMQKLQR